MATLHMMIGLPCSGKTTRARQLEREFCALRLTPDPWHLRLFGDDTVQPEHDGRHTAVEVLMWEVAARVLELGCDVILDFGFWPRWEREMFRQRAAALGAGSRLHYMDVPMAELKRRLEERNRSGDPNIFVIPPEELERYATLFEPPAADELIARPAPSAAKAPQSNT